MVITRSILVAVFAFLLTIGGQVCHSSNDGRLPPRPPFTENGIASLESSTAPTIFFNNVEIALEKTTLSEVLKTVGTGKIEHHGDAGDSEYWICYIDFHKGPQRIWIASGETGGDNHVVQSFYAEPIDKIQIADESCDILPKNFHPLSLSNQIWLGQTQDELIKKLGQPAGKDHNWWLYKYSGPASIKGYDEVSSFSVLISDKKIVALFFSKVVTN